MALVVIAKATKIAVATIRQKNLPPELNFMVVRARLNARPTSASPHPRKATDVLAHQSTNPEAFVAPCLVGCLI